MVDRIRAARSPLGRAPGPTRVVFAWPAPRCGATGSGPTTMLRSRTSPTTTCRPPEPTPRQEVPEQHVEPLVRYAVDRQDAPVPVQQRQLPHLLSAIGLRPAASQSALFTSYCIITLYLYFVIDIQAAREYPAQA